jgi:hypothetical protein
LDAIWTPAPSFLRLDSTRTPHFETCGLHVDSTLTGLQFGFGSTLATRARAI